MINMRPYVPSNRIAIRDSIDEDISDDVDDEVFIKDSKTSKVISYFIMITLPKSPPSCPLKRRTFQQTGYFPFSVVET